MVRMISFHNVSKQYRIGSYRGSLRAFFSRLVERRADHSPQILKALDNVTFDVHAGEAVGLIGPNGAGKTTILKLISKVTYATSGVMEVGGRVSALIQLGAGFHPDLSGRDNIYLNGSILGLSRAETHRRFDEIVAFSEMEQFIDTPVKRYSSGMYARLGFAVAVHVSPDILLVDEVLAVGDTAFQYKCLRKMREFIEQGRTVVFVSHNLDAVQGLCRRVLWIDHGTLCFDGPAGGGIDAYLTSQEKRFMHSRASMPQPLGVPLQITTVKLRNGEGKEINEFASGMLFLATMLTDGTEREDLSGSGMVSCRFHGISLMPKVYQVWGSVRDDSGFGDLVDWQPLCSFRIVAPPRALLGHNARISISHLKNDAPIYVPHEWSFSEHMASPPSVVEER